MTVLQSLVFPNLDVHAHEDMYFRLSDGAWVDLKSRKASLEAGSILSTDTFFNGLSVGVWKRRCDIGSLSLRVEGSGEFVATVGLHRLGQMSVWLDEHRLSMFERQESVLTIGQWPALSDGLLFVRFRALGPAVITGAHFETVDSPLRSVRLGLVITHFNRQKQVLPAIARIREALLDHPVLRDSLTLTVVDNSSNLPLAPHPRITHILNRNLGGTGGFVRGLLSLIDDAGHSHALFMDDDASCETESIARSLALLQFARHDTLSVAGALLRELAPWELLEKGARFDGTVVALNPGLDMRHVHDLLVAERPGLEADYGAWWFFAFPLAAVRRLPFPFFVRGDDIFFGLHNAFDIVTLNGVACLGEDFSSKHGPMTAYLDARYHLVHAFLAPGGSASTIFWVGSRLFVKALNGYLYSSARAVTLAMQHILEGPEFFRRNLDMKAVRDELNSFSPNEKLLPIDRSALAPRAERAHRESIWRRLARTVTLQGFLLPDALIRDRLTVQPKAFHGRASAVFRYRRVLYEHAASGTGFVAEFDRPRFFRELGRFLKTWALLFARRKQLRSAYESGAQQMSTLEFWRSVYPETRSVVARAEAVPAPLAGR
jgi:galactofuranosylgalactofuranosylrhamnosyl-N-acetylglucosaminyl-diphospho-decaprenol beta-1,5/1,6-galactofuranosyltransferase